MITINRTYKKPDKLWNPIYVLGLFLGVLMAIGLFMVNPVLTKYVTHLGGSLSVAGVLVSCISITTLFIRPVSGYITDRVYTKVLTITATVVAGTAILGYAFSDNITLLFVFRVLNGIGMAFHSTCAMASASFFIPEDRMSEGMSYMGIGNIFATAVGPNFGLWVIERYGYKTTFIISAILILSTALLSLIFVYPPKPEKKSPAQMTKVSFRLSELVSPKLLPLAMFGGMFAICNTMVNSFLALVGDARGIANVGLFFTVNAVALGCARIFGGRLTDKLGIRKILVPSFVFTIVSMLLLARANAIWYLVIAAVALAIGQGSAQPMIQGECIKQMPLQRGLAMSTFYLGSDVLNSLGGIVGGKIADNWGYGPMYYSAACLMFVGLLLFALYAYRRGEKKCITSI